MKIFSLGNLSVGRKLGYAVGCITYSLPYQISMFVFLIYATAILKVPPLWAGVIIAISAVWDAISDPLMGYFSDNTQSDKFGRRHQYLLLGGTLTAIFTMLFWSISPELELWLKISLLLVLILALKTSLTVFFVPYNALGAELSTDYEERSSIQSYRGTFYVIGVILASIGSHFIFFRPTAEFSTGQLNPDAYPSMGLLFAAIAVVATLVMFFATKAYIPLLPQQSIAMQKRLKSIKSAYGDLLTAWQNKDFIALAMMIFIIEAAFHLSVVLSLHIQTYTYHLPAKNIGILGITLLMFSIVSQPFWLWMIKKLDKKKAAVVGMLIALVGFIGPSWTHVWWELFPINTESLPYTLWGFSMLAGIGNGAFISIPYSMIADSVDFEEVKTGKRDEGLYYGLFTFAYKFGASISLLFSGIVLSLIGFDAELAEQTEHTQFYLAMVPSFLLVIFVPFALYALSRYSINRERYHEVRLLLDKNRGN